MDVAEALLFAMAETQRRWSHSETEPVVAGLPGWLPGVGRSISTNDIVSFVPAATPVWSEDGALTYRLGASDRRAAGVNRSHETKILGVVVGLRTDAAFDVNALRRHWVNTFVVVTPPMIRVFDS